ncbi:hypothetical protein LOD99_13089 [Oopsacas minuta]|uniref:Glycerophosphoryl diester phosphodiesterase membrane domain-containing protein n=1 Tax=Oopsacas minuta TaxID=111878 RepID=A0AAV7JAV0_9METZ|nr:hypothetical protein LOD99_13089 [Oopsacas minuta]
MIIKRRYRRALADVRDFETEAILKDLKSRLVKHVILILICFFEVTAAILAFVSVLPPIEYTLFLFYYSITSTYLTFCLLNILTSYLIRVYTYKPDSRQDRNSLIKFILKLAFTIFLPAIFYLIVFSTLLIILLFIGEIVMFIINGRMLDKVIGWKQQDLALEFGSEGRVLAIKRMRRRFRLFKAVFIACSSFLILGFPTGVLQYYLEYSTTNPNWQENMIFVYPFRIYLIPFVIIHVINNLVKIPITILALFYLFFTMQYFCASTCENIYYRLCRCLIRNSQNPNTKPLLQPE